jgi:hypothetical protein
MTLGNMHENRVRSLAASFWICHHQAVLSADSWPDDVPPAYRGRIGKSGPRARAQLERNGGETYRPVAAPAPPARSIAFAPPRGPGHHGP